MPVKIGFYICHCGVNIAGKVRVGEVADFVLGLPDVTVSRDYKFMCSDPGQEMIQADIRDMGLTRVVVASCSPRLHGKTFMGACQRAGLNPYYFQMASVREQVSWVTEDETLATDKAKSLAAAAVNRVRFHESLSARNAKVHPDVMVVGGGIAGIQSALDIADSGAKVYLVERSPTIGGHMLQFDKTFPTLDCAACIGTPKMVSVGQHPNIELLTCSEVEEVSGYIGNFQVTVRENARYVDTNLCTGCGDCAEVCPVSVPSEWDEGLTTRKAVYRSFQQAVPSAFCIDKKDRAPCTQACPAGVNVQGYIQLIRREKYEKAVGLIMEKLPLPGVLARVCPHPCETECRRAQLDEAVSIRELKRAATDRGGDLQVSPPEMEREEKVAIIGSGPAGLTAAYYLRLKGYRVTVFEALNQLGGMLRVGIPDYRLPPAVLDRDIGRILDMGVEFKTGVRFGRDITLESLSAVGFSAVFLGIGAHAGLRLGIEGEESRGVEDAVHFLRRVNLGDQSGLGRNVCVIGGGNVAVDAARSALRLSSEVSILYRRTRGEMPAYPEEIEEALEEGVLLEELTTPVRIVTENSLVVAVECIRNEPGPPDESGRRRPVPVQGSEFTIPCDAVIPAIGQKADAAGADFLPGLKWDERGWIEADPRTLQTSIPNVFAAGDAVGGPATVIEAVANGRKAAEAMAAYMESRLETDFAGKELKPVDADEKDWAPIPPDAERKERVRPVFVEPAVRIQGFAEAALGLPEDKILHEADRCLNCGVCSECMECVAACERGAIDHMQKTVRNQIPVGAIILATGFDLFDPSGMKQFGYGRFPNVFSSLEFERLNNATGPTGGEIRMRDENGGFTRPPESVAIVHCVGSRDVNYHEYCSRVCCMYALKYGHLIHDKIGPHAKVYDFYIDLRCFGKGYEEFYRRCQEEGIRFIRGKPAQIEKENGRLIVVGEDTLLGEIYRIPVDMAILCAAVQARFDAPEVGRVFGVNLGRDGFFLEEHPKLAPLSTATDGIFLAGTCQAPKDVPDTVSQASGAAAKALSLITRGTVEIEPTTSRIDPDICAGCQTCIGLCPYSAIEFDPRRNISVVNDALCKGCGSCSGFCPSGAARVRHFNGRQIFSEIDGLFDAIHAVGGQ